MTYKVELLSGISDGWILDHVTPNMARCGIPRDVCLVLGRAMLWRIFDRSGEDLVPSAQRMRIMARYEDLGADNHLEPGTNPVKKVPVVVNGYDAEVLMDEIVVGDDGDNDEGPSVVLQRMGLRHQEIRLLASQVTHLRRELLDSRVEHERQMQVSCGVLFCFTYLNDN